jgi:hypothetical protein
MTKLNLGPLEIPKPSHERKDMVAIEELSPEAIIPDSVTVYRDPEVEIPEEEFESEMELGRKLTEIDLDRMSDDKTPEREVKGKSQGNDKLARKAQRKRKLGFVDGIVEDEPQRKMAVSPSSASSLKRGGRG